MAQLSERLAQAGQAIIRLREAADLAEPSVMERDAAILRFTVAYEAVWKAARIVLQEQEGSDEARSGSPRGTIRASRVAGWLTDEDAEAALRMSDDRNMILHAYADPVAEALHARIPDHASLLERWLSKLKSD